MRGEGDCHGGAKRAEKRRAALFLVALMSLLAACGRPASHEAGVVRFVIESNPANLDPRYATDGQSQRIVGLLFNGLVERDAEMKLHGDLAESWETPDALTYVFHLRKGLKFHDGREMTAKDVKATLEWMMNPANKSPKRGAFRLVAAVKAADPWTVIFHLKELYASFVWNVARPAVGIVPADAGVDFAQRPIGTGPFRFVSQAQDDAVVIEKNAAYFRGASGQEPGEKVIFRIVPDAIVRALELRKGSADVEVSSLSPDMIPVLVKQADLELTERPGTNFAYLGINFEHAALAKREVRQALTYATDRESLIRYLLRGEARLASGLLPPNHWAYEGNVKRYGYDPAEAEKSLDAGDFREKRMERGCT